MAKALGRWGVVSLVLLALSGSASGQDYPTKPIRLVVPYPAGGVVDFVARQIGQKMAGSMGQSIVVENRVGAGGTIATETTAKSAPDRGKYRRRCRAHGKRKAGSAKLRLD